MKKIIKNIIEDQNDNNVALTSENSPPLLYKDLKLFVKKILASTKQSINQTYLTGTV